MTSSKRGSLCLNLEDQESEDAMWHNSLTAHNNREDVWQKYFMLCEESYIHLLERYDAVSSKLDQFAMDILDLYPEYFLTKKG